MQAKLEENNVFKEIWKTENTYNASLKFLYLSLLIQLRFNEHTLLRKFSNIIEQLLDVSDKLLLNVENGLANVNNPETREGLKLERSSLLNRFFELYKSYSILFDEYALEYKSNPDQFKQINFYMIQNSGSRLGLDAHLIMPIQRGPRYELLIKEIQKQNIGDEFNKNEFSTLQQMFNDHLSDFSSKKKSEPEQESSYSEKHPYHFGDYTRYYLFGQQNTTIPSKEIVLTADENRNNVDEKSEIQSGNLIEEKPSSLEAKGYRFGDLTRRLIWGANKNSQVKNTISVPRTEGSKQDSIEENIEQCFEII